MLHEDAKKSSLYHFLISIAKSPLQRYYGTKMSGGSQYLYKCKKHTKLKTYAIITCIESNAPNWEALKTHLYKEGKVSKEHC